MSSEYKYYSIILKGCYNREHLERRLEKILLRGRLAIKMALDTIPCVIIYKGNVDTIIPIFKALITEYAIITIFADGVPPTLPIAKKYRDFLHINPNLQALLIDVPENLWLGEAIHRIIPASFLDEAGALVVSSHAIYFIDKPAGDTKSRWLIIPYEQLNDPLNLGEQETQLIIHYQNAAVQQNDVFTIPREFVASAKRSIEQAKLAQKYLIKIKTHCITCGYRSEDTIAHAPTETHCQHCGKPYQRTIIV
ncbi:hypothetical protein SOV_53180 [Sporomusa ovata DSM 2662]|uniref:Uncharacterized protein n=1 Tax=Sporomusa ovata TaxID=2378 RepID=A0A0U1KSD4_9FIRM|nr:hypothetical protein [Sporomusa ovata]EQB27686.1 hypothetical protein SOV_2c05870 [Sporomusa ovata DSM 2662]CQR70039.1 hypothetical protein SpAn4DRAFT_4904 [Sporomusa ovata]